MKRIDITQYEKSGEGANGESFNSRVNPNEMLKLYNKGYDTTAIEVELEAAEKVFGLGIPSPKPGELVTDGERIGILFERIPNKTSFARAIADNTDLIDIYAQKFAKMCQELHATKCEAGLFPDANEQFLQLLGFDTAFNEEEKAKIADFIRNVENPGTALHGDMHFGNAVISGDARLGDEKSQLLWIDLGYFAQGNPLYDLGMLYLICVVDDDGFVYENFHFHTDVANDFWKLFVKYYFNGEKTVEEAEALIRPYAAVKSLLIEHNCGDVLFPQFEKIFRETILG